jgi:hypothetical protein
MKDQEFSHVVALLSYDPQVPLDYDPIREFLPENDASCVALNSRTLRHFSHQLVDHLSSLTDSPCAPEAASFLHNSTLLSHGVIHFTGDTDSNEDGDADGDADKRAFTLHQSAALASDLIDLTGDAAEKLRRAFLLSLAEEASLEDVVLPDGILISGPRYCQVIPLYYFTGVQELSSGMTRSSSSTRHHTCSRKYCKDEKLSLHYSSAIILASLMYLRPQPPRRLTSQSSTHHRTTPHHYTTRQRQFL